MTDEPIGVCYTIWMSDNSAAAIEPEDAALVDRAVKVWVDSGRTRDAWLSLRQPGGADFSVLASTITASLVTTADQRANAMVRDAGSPGSWNQRTSRCLAPASSSSGTRAPIAT
jgi:hypothetical protein